MIWGVGRHAVAAMAEQGNNLIVDEVMIEARIAQGKAAAAGAAECARLIEPPA